MKSQQEAEKQAEIEKRRSVSQSQLMRGQRLIRKPKNNTINPQIKKPQCNR
jgi:hypothetical protein